MGTDRQGVVRHFLQNIFGVSARLAFVRVNRHEVQPWMEKGKPEIIGCCPVFKTGAAAPWACQASPEADVQVHLHGKQARYKSNCRINDALKQTVGSPLLGEQGIQLTDSGFGPPLQSIVQQTGQHG